MANEAQRDPGPGDCFPVDGVIAEKEAASAKGSVAVRGKLPYTRPTLRSLGTVAELTFGLPQGSLSDGIRRRAG
jgi:hypothetical protein